MMHLYSKTAADSVELVVDDTTASTVATLTRFCSNRIFIQNLQNCFCFIQNNFFWHIQREGIISFNPVEVPGKILVERLQQIVGIQLIVKPGYPFTIYIRLHIIELKIG